VTRELTQVACRLFSALLQLQAVDPGAPRYQRRDYKKMKTLDVGDRMLALQIVAQLPDDAGRGRALLAAVADLAEQVLYCETPLSDNVVELVRAVSV
jgi:hypothetical protein